MALLLKARNLLYDITLNGTLVKSQSASSALLHAGIDCTGGSGRGIYRELFIRRTDKNETMKRNRDIGRSDAGKRDNFAAIALVVSSLLFYLVSVPGLFPLMGGGVVGFLVIPALIISWYAGGRWGLLIGFLGGFVLNSVMLAFLYGEWVPDVLVRHKGIPGAILVVLLCGGAGYFRELRGRLLKVIREKTAVQKQLELSRANLEQVLRTIPSAVFSVDRECRITSWNRAAEKVTGLNSETVMGKKCTDVWDSPSCRSHCGMKDGSASKPITGREMDISLPGGRQISVVMNLDVIFDNNGNFIGGVESFIDVTHHKKMEKEVEETARGFQTLFDRSSEGLYLFDPETGEYIAVNQAMSRITGYEQDDLIGSSHERFAPEEDRSTLRGIMAPLKAGMSLEAQQGRIVCRDGSIRHVIFGATPIVWRGKRVLYGFIRDITSIKEMQLELERKNREITDLTNTISHDLRNPLAGIKGILELYRFTSDDADKGQDEEMHALALKEVKYMQELLDDLLEAAKLDTKNHSLALKKISLATFLEERIELFKQQINKYGISVSLEVGGIEVCVDEHAFEKVCMNLIGNAIDYRSPSRRGVITISGETAGGEVTIRFRDNGIGIRREDLAGLFEKFRRGSNSGEVKGTGLGLAIVRGIVEAHRGSVRIESAEGEWSEFIITLPQREGLCS